MLKKQYKLPGFTLLETLLAVFLVSVFTILAVPTLNYWYIENHKKAMIYQLLSRLNLVRSEAIKRKQHISLCKSHDGQTIGGEWWQGQIVLDESLRVIYRYPGFADGELLFWRSSLSKNNCITYDSLGFLLGQKGSFYFAWRNFRQQMRILTLQECGRVRVVE